MLGNRDNLYYWYNDNYMYFSFNGIHSSVYHLFIQNSKQLQLENAVGESSEYSNAILQEGTYYLGTSRKQKTFKRKCAAEGLTKDKYREMMSWLTAGTTGELIFDSDIYWGWTVVLDSVGDASFAVYNDTLTVEFEITFKTIGTYLAHSVYPATWSSEDDEAYISVIGTNQYLIPPIVINDETPDETPDKTPGDLSDNIYTHKYRLRIQDICNKKQDFSFRINSAEKEYFNGNVEFKVSCNGTDYNIATLNVPAGETGASQFEFDSGKSIININNSIAEDYTYCKNTKQLHGMLQLSSSMPVELYTESFKIEEIKDEEGEEGNIVQKNIVIKLDEQSAYLFESGKYDYICVCHKSDAYTAFGNAPYTYDENDETSQKEDYKADFLSYIGFNDNIYPLSKNIGKFTLNNIDNTVTLELDDTASFSKKLTENQYKVYCGYNKDIIITLTETNIANSTTLGYRATVTSYNNL